MGFHAGLIQIWASNWVPSLMCRNEYYILFMCSFRVRLVWFGLGEIEMIENRGEKSRGKWFYGCLVGEQRRGGWKIGGGLGDFFPISPIRKENREKKISCNQWLYYPSFSQVNFFFFGWDSFNICHSLLMIALYHHIKTLIDFWCRRWLNPKSLIDLVAFSFFSLSLSLSLS